MASPTLPVIILTGASRGTGLAIAHYLLRAPASARVVGTARTLAPLQDLRTQYGENFEFVCGDISQSSVREEALSKAVIKFGRISAVIVNHAVLDPVQKVADADLGGWKASFEVNYFSVLDLVARAIPELRKARGRVVFVSSAAAVAAYHGWAAYGGSKAAMNHLNLTLATEEPDLVSIAISPGVIDTQMQQDIREKHGQVMGADQGWFLDMKESGNLLRPEQPGNVIARLALSAGQELSGKFLNWDAKELAAYQD